MTDRQTQLDAVRAEPLSAERATSKKTPTPTGPVDATHMDGKQVDKLIAAGWRTDPNAHNNVLLPPPGGAGGGSFNSKHPRASKGQPTGGQFITAGSGSSSGGPGGKKASAKEKAQVMGVQAEIGVPRTGVFSASDVEALKKWQKKQGLKVDGLAGVQTVSRMSDGPDVKPGALTAENRKFLEDRATQKRSVLPPIDAFRHVYRSSSTAEQQIQWGLDYIERRYGSADAASRAMAMTLEPVVGGKGKGLFGIPGEHLPPYMEHVINDLIEKGTPKERAIPTGIGIVRNWRDGHDGHGNKVSAETQAKAAEAWAAWEASKAKAHTHGSDHKAHSGRALMTTYSRTFNLEDIAVRSGAGYEDGRTVEAYAAVYDVPARIRDHEGEYEEVIDRSCFDRAVDHAKPQGGRQSWKCGVFYNHARTIFGTPSDRHSEPIGVCLDIRPDARGLLTVTRYLAAADNILDAIREGAITSYSFSGSFVRSTPQLPASRNAQYRRGVDGSLTQVRRLESSLREYGPTPFPAYDEAQVVGMRAEQIAMALGTLDRGEREQLAEILRSDPVLLDDTEADMQQSGTTGTPEDGTAPGDSQRDDDELHSTRNHTNRLWRSRLRDALADRNIALPGEERQ